MAYQLLYFDEVITDIREAKQWYKEQREGLEIEFAIAIESTIRQILKLPLGYATRYKNIRIAHPKRFPYNIHFYVDTTNSTVTITAIVHNKRRPKIAKNRKG